MPFSSILDDGNCLLIDDYTNFRIRRSNKRNERHVKFGTASSDLSDFIEDGEINIVPKPMLTQGTLEIKLTDFKTALQVERPIEK